MKRWISLAAVIGQLIAGCGNSGEDEAKPCIPGVYITAYEGNYSIGNDTIEIRQQGNKESNSYLIIKRNAHQRKENGRIKQEMYYKRSIWLGTWNEPTKTIVISRNGRTLLFDRKGKEMKIGITVYNKIKVL